MSDLRKQKLVSSAATRSAQAATLKKEKLIGREPATDIKFEKGHEPKGKLVQFEKQPVVLRFTPSSYRAVEPNELKEWQRDVAERLGQNFDIVPGGAGTISFCKRGGSGAAYRCDSDMDSAGAERTGNATTERLKPWNSTPVVLDFDPVAYEAVDPTQLKDWAADLEKQFGIKFDIGTGSGGTISFCKRGGSGAAYRCDSDIG